MLVVVANYVEKEDNWLKHQIELDLHNAPTKLDLERMQHEIT